MNVRLLTTPLSTLLIAASLAEEQEPLTLDRLKESPASLSEAFYPVNGSLIKIEDDLIRGIKIAAEAGKSHARITVLYRNTTDEPLAPAYTLKIYNPYGILMSWVSVPESPPGESVLKPDSTGNVQLRPRIMRLDPIFRHSTLGDYPDDFFEIRWVSVNADHKSIERDRP